LAVCAGEKDADQHRGDCVDLLFDHPESSIGMSQLMDIQARQCSHARPQGRHRDVSQPSPAPETVHRGLGVPAVSIIAAHASPASGKNASDRSTLLRSWNVTLALHIQ
jgi:hypothetical protein